MTTTVRDSGSVDVMAFQPIIYCISKHFTSNFHYYQKTPVEVTLVLIMVTVTKLMNTILTLLTGETLLKTLFISTVFENTVVGVRKRSVSEPQLPV